MPDHEEELRSVLMTAWPEARIEPSALAILPDINLDALREVAAASRRVQPSLGVTCVKGFRSREDSDWVQLLLATGYAGETGDEAWRETLERAGAVIESAVEHSPRLAGVIARQISFDI